MDRQDRKQRFIEEYIDSWYNIEPMNADASFRSYQRIKTPIKTYVLMDSPPEHYSIEPFEKVANWLLQNNLSAPEIFHRDAENGFLLLEDFGDVLIKHLLDEEIHKHYMKAMDVLVTLHKFEPPSWLESYTNNTLIKELEIFTDYYIPLVTGHPLSSQAKSSYLLLWQEILEKLPNLGEKIVLKDYHVENLMHLAERQGVQSLGILDFQDAVIGSPIYDVVSLLEDARHEVPFAFAQEIFEYYLTQTNIDRDAAYLAYDILGAQRNIRILGVFARKKLRDKNDSYLQFIPRVLNYLQRDLQNPVFLEIREVHNCIIAPDTQL